MVSDCHNVSAVVGSFASVFLSSHISRLGSLCCGCGTDTPGLMFPAWLPVPAPPRLFGAPFGCMSLLGWQGWAVDEQNSFFEISKI